MTCCVEGHKPEPIPGLPDDLPKGERILWRGSPNWKSFAMHVFHVRAVAIYFAILVVWKVSAALGAGTGAMTAMIDGVSVISVALAGLGIMGLLAWLMARSTIYTITNERVVIRAGVALPKAMNIPFAIIGSAALKTRSSGNGDIPLQLTGPDRVAYLHMWPHVRPMRFNKAEPMLRGIDAASPVADILARALAEKTGQSSPRVVVEEAPQASNDRLPGQSATAAG